MATEEASQDQRKRTLEEALERRFAVARAEAMQQQERRSNNRKFDRGSGREGDGGTGITSTVSSSITSLNKEANDPTYSLLSQTMHENLLVQNLEISSRRGTGVDKVLHELLQKGDSAQKYMQGSRSMRLNDVILLDNFVPKRSTLAGARLRALRSHSKRSKTRMSMKQHKKCGSFDLPQDLKFDFFKPMHEIWKGYIAELLNISGWLSASSVRIYMGLLFELCPREVLFFCSKLIAGRLHYVETSFLQEIRICHQDNVCFLTNSIILLLRSCIYDFVCTPSLEYGAFDFNYLFLLQQLII
ncbi:ribonuclease MRP protein subunit POP4 isoform X2 [Rhodamnia argentea]|uniref:Ribonuclease MRP protein subunit POP4 isoform X2 n=1 Tax=Rhodamnia argentea TaxID=178133 RepID=A0ABM3HYB6_9MYRT|nr:ribonuclease MRP protein subunit POP4 isoform X2 [Rhodamnia argentea]